MLSRKRNPKQLSFIKTFRNYIHTKFFNVLFRDKAAKCLINDEKKRLTKELHRKMEILAPQDRVLSSGGAISHLLKPGRQIYQLRSFSKIIPEYDYLLLELQNAGDIYPLNGEQILAIKERCQNRASTTLIDNQYFYFAKGPFTEECLKQRDLL